MLAPMTRAQPPGVDPDFEIAVLLVCLAAVYLLAWSLA
jgi:hypothetical protein